MIRVNKPVRLCNINLLLQWTIEKCRCLVVKPATIRTVLSLVVSRQWPIHQLDVKNAFLNGDLSETVYMHQPSGFVDSRYPNLVCLLQRSLYSLKQGSQVAYLLIYVDDIILTASSPVLLQQIVDSLHKEFDMTDLEALNYFLGISVVRHPTGLLLSQKKYALQLLERAHMVNCNPCRTPVDTDFKLGPDGVPVCLYMHDPRELHFAALKRIMRYVQGTLELSLHLYAFATTSLVGYTDADWSGCPSTRRSTSGYCVFLGDNLLSWSAKRQHTISRSSDEVKYRGVANVVAETAWICNLLRELHSPLLTATLVYCDNVSAVYMSANLYADIFTKCLPSTLFEDFRSSLSVRPPPAQTARAPPRYVLPVHEKLDCKKYATRPDCHNKVTSVADDVYQNSLKVILTILMHQLLKPSNDIQPQRKSVKHDRLVKGQPAQSASHHPRSCRRVIPFDHFINNDLEYLRGGASSRKYTTSVTKTKAADYRHIKWIKDLVPQTMWIQEPVGYDKHALWGISHWERKRQRSTVLLLTGSLLAMSTLNVESSLSLNSRLSRGTITSTWIGSRTIDMAINQQVVLDEALVPHARRLRIGRSNFHLKSDISSKESTLQLVHSGAIRRLTDVNINNLHQPWRSFTSIINKCLSGKSSGYDSLRLSQAQFLCGFYHKRNVDFAYLLWEYFVYQVEHKDTKMSNEMYYHRFTKVIIHYFLSNDPSIPMRNKFGAILPIELTNADIRNSKAYKEYYAVATGATPPKTKASVQKTKSSSDTTVTPPPTATAGTRLFTFAKGKKPATTSKAKNERIGTIPGVLDVPTEESDEEISWKSSDEGDGGDDDDQKEGNDDDQDSDEEGEEFIHPRISVHDEEETRDEESWEKDKMKRMMKTNYIEMSTSIWREGFAGAVSSIPGIVQRYMDQRMNEAVNVAIQIQSDRLRDEAQAKNGESLKTINENMQKIIKEQVKDQVKVQVSKILPKIEQTVNEKLEAEVLTRSSNSSKTSYAVAADLSEMELKKILIEKMQGNKSIYRSNEQRNLYNAQVKAYESDRIILDTCRDTSNSSKTSYAVAADLSEMELKKILIEKMEGNKSIHRSNEQRNLYNAQRRRDDDADKDQEPFAGSDRGSKRRREGKEPESASAPKEKATRSAGNLTQGSKSRQTSASESTTAEEPMHTTHEMEEPSHPEFETGADDQPIAEPSQHPEWFSQQKKPPTPDRDWNKTLSATHGSIQPWISELAKQTDHRSSFNELMDTPVDFSAFLMNRLKVDTLTPELLAGPTYEFMKGSCKSLVELEFFLEEVYKATTDQLD
nr:ribonuclease H-like domain-containing protein [Tanacetum cinerariifolium]